MDRVSPRYQDPGIGYPGSRGPTRRGQLGSRETTTEREEVPGGGERRAQGAGLKGWRWRWPRAGSAKDQELPTTTTE